MLIRFAEVLRDIARGGLAGLIAGLIVGGLGGRVAMMLAARMNPGATGMFTENGELIGAFTLNGTFALMIFGGLLLGLVAGIVWVVLSPWLPASGPRRRLAAGLLAAALGSSFLVQADNLDFAILGNDAAIIAMLVLLVGLIGLAMAWADDVLDRRLPRPGGHPIRYLLAYGLITTVGLVVVPMAIGLFVSRETCGCGNPPVFVGWALIGVGVLTASWWVMRITTGRTERPRALIAAGRLGVIAAAGLGAIHLASEVSDILARA